MCGGSRPSVDNTARLQAEKDARRARAKEEARQERIRTGTKKISTAFGAFDDDYYDSVRDTQMDYYKPQIDRQFGDARDDLIYTLARAGTLNSSIAGEAQSDLATRYNDNLASILSKAQATADNQRRKVMQEKSALISLLNQTGNSDRTSNEALARSQKIFDERPSYNPLGDIFAGAMQGIGINMEHNRERRYYDNYMGSSGGGKSSYRVVGG